MELNLTDKEIILKRLLENNSITIEEFFCLSRANIIKGKEDKKIPADIHNPINIDSYPQLKINYPYQGNYYYTDSSEYVNVLNSSGSISTSYCDSITTSK